LTPDEIQKAATLYANCADGEFARKCDEQIISPVLPRINTALGQDNDARYLAYMVEYTFIVAKTRRHWQGKRQEIKGIARDTSAVNPSRRRG
jgi:hypothetical protein